MGFMEETLTDADSGPIPHRKIGSQVACFEVEVVLSNENYFAEHPHAFVTGSLELAHRMSQMDTGTSESINLQETFSVNNATLGAHKHVLAQWLYIRTMIEGGFLKSGPSEKRVIIRDTKPTTFRLLLRFIYLVYVTHHQDRHRTTVFADTFEDKNQSSWEELSVSADRYDLQNLRKEAMHMTVNSLNTSQADHEPLGLLP
ncbi:hypothetical protein MVEG_03799 [Podila verticillata NRRL 6337]|nr:hypothetical protein MVEG_03799 [Podila verticillata NRRL 6337]